MNDLQIFMENCLFRYITILLSISSQLVRGNEATCFIGEINDEHTCFLDAITFDPKQMKTSINKGAFQSSESVERVEITNSKLVCIPTQIFTIFENLKTLTISDGNSNLNMIKPSDLLGANNLETLQLSNNKIEKIVLSNFIKARKIKLLDLSSNRISEIEPHSFTGLERLQKLNLNDNQLKKLSSGMFTALFNLKELRVSNNKISEMGSQAFKYNKKLVMITLRGNLCINKNFVPFMLHENEKEISENCPEKPVNPFDDEKYLEMAGAPISRVYKNPRFTNDEGDFQVNTGRDEVILTIREIPYDPHHPKNPLKPQNTNFYESKQPPISHVYNNQPNSRNSNNPQNNRPNPSRDNQQRPNNRDQIMTIREVPYIPHTLLDPINNEDNYQEMYKPPTSTIFKNPRVEQERERRVNQGNSSPTKLPLIFRQPQPFPRKENTDLYYMFGRPPTEHVPPPSREVHQDTPDNSQVVSSNPLHQLNADENDPEFFKKNNRQLKASLDQAKATIKRFEDLELDKPFYYLELDNFHKIDESQ